MTIVVSFYTLKTPYEQEVLHLLHSCEQWNLDYCIEGRPSLGSWERNCTMKPSFILEKLHQFKKPLLWVDADAVFLQDPSLHTQCASWLDYDLGVRIDPYASWENCNKVTSGTLFVNYTPQALTCIELWEKRCQEALTQKQDEWDQVVLRDLLASSPESLRVFSLPLSYCTVFDLDRFFIPEKEIIIEHRQASRRFKKQISEEG